MSDSAATALPEQKVFGLLTRKPRWGLSGRGWLCALVSFGATLAAFWLGAYPFLSITSPISSRIFVVEGWIPTGTLPTVAGILAAQNAEHILVVRGLKNVDDVYESGRYSGDYVAQTLVNNGIPREKVETLFFPVAQKDRTFHSGLVVQRWLHDHAPTTSALNLVTVGPHARRSRLLYEKALGDTIQVGIISAVHPDYDPRNWWKNSAGVRDVVGEAIAYLYARFLFFPADESSPANAASPDR